MVLETLEDYLAMYAVGLKFPEELKPAWAKVVMDEWRAGLESECGGLGMVNIGLLPERQALAAQIRAGTDPDILKIFEEGYVRSHKLSGDSGGLPIPKFGSWICGVLVIHQEWLELPTSNSDVRIEQEKFLAQLATWYLVLASLGLEKMVHAVGGGKNKVLLVSI